MIGLIENVLWNPEKAIEVLRKGAEIQGRYYYRTLTEIAFSEYYMGRTEALYENYLHQMGHKEELTRLDTMHAYFGALLYFWKTRELRKAIGIIETLDEMFYNSEIEKGLLNRETLLIAIEKMREIFYDRMMLQAKGYNIMGDITYDLGDYSKAIEYYSSSISIKSITGDLTGRAISLQGSARAFMQLGKLEDAKIRAMNSYRTNLDKDDKYGMYQASILMTRICIESGEIAESRKWLNNVSGLMSHARKEYDRNKYYIVKWLCDIETENPETVADEIEERLASGEFSDFITAEYRYCLGRACEDIDRDKSLGNYRKALMIYEGIRKKPDADRVKRRLELLGGSDRSQ
jgi:tetratricopeptide (TPR) repeat protein